MEEEMKAQRQARRMLHGQGSLEANNQRAKIRRKFDTVMNSPGCLHKI